MKTAFNESFVSKHVHPAFFDKKTTLPEVYGDDPKVAAFEIASRCIIEITEWEFGNLRVKPGDVRYLKAVALHSIARAWVINPATFGGCSLRSLAKTLGVKATFLSRRTAEFSRVLGVKNGFKAHDWRKPKNEEAQSS